MVEQKLDCVNLMVNEGCTNKQIIKVLGVGTAAAA
jgi:hypothetical protein